MQCELQKISNAPDFGQHVAVIQRRHAATDKERQEL
jgi:hypothetical protein